ncbi:uncharacterized protein LOC135493212 isoform X2 [Lineus longissimus]|uniref:uncharacterized protein LOC135493212 isoform X2 n=1 Tax=Lineus longissimus TaxID=88925 RepID=UPI00315D5390
MASSSWIQYQKVICLVFVLGLVKDIAGQCTFPEWLQTPSKKGWITKRDYYTSANYWREQIHVMVEEQSMTYEKVEKQCEDDIQACERVLPMYKRSCVKNMGQGRYLVKHEQTGRGEQYLCMHVSSKTKNVLQVKYGPTSSLMDDSLCIESKLNRDEWPWVSQDHKEWTFCPLVGGFEFHTFSYATQEDICPSEWRLSRVEIDCMKGEGMEFMFPDTGCNPFWETETTRLFCYGNWEENGFKYVMLNIPGEFPKYSMRLPLILGGSNQDVFLYKGLVAPTASDGRPPDGVKHFKMSMKRSDSALCTDESDKCQEFARAGYCTSRPRYEYAQYCKRSCRICDRNGASISVENDPSGQAECLFPKEYQGGWKLYQKDRVEDVAFTERHVFFTTLGKFVCKSKDYAEAKYKVLATYFNGCRPRYTCMEFATPSDNLLQYRLSESHKMDTHFKKLCVFKDDPEPLGDMFRGKHMKTLVTRSKIKNTNCNIYGVTPVTASVGDTSCKGSISDWDPFKCNKGSELTVTLNQCPKLKRSEEYTCIARINPKGDANSDSYLFTQSKNNSEVFNCWIIHRNGDGSKVIYKMPSPQCDPDTSSLVTTKKPPAATYQLFEDKRTQTCFEKTTEAVATTPSSKNTKPFGKDDMSKEPKDQSRTGTDGKNDVQKPGSVRTSASSVQVNVILVVFLAILTKMAAH